jgi:tetratricopeptide (TPR) repeat protein
MAPPPEALARVSDAVARASPAEDGVGDIVVTGSRVSRGAAAAARRGNWNACTVDDPQQTLRGCKRLVRSGATGPAGTAGAALAGGLALAWQGDWSGAIDAFDRAIEAQPKLGFAYLNRGLALQHLGEGQRAAADLDRAVRYDPSARSYYHRSKLRASIDDHRGAKADGARAAELDSDYAPLIEE